MAKGQLRSSREKKKPKAEKNKKKSAPAASPFTLVLGEALPARNSRSPMYSFRRQKSETASSWEPFRSRLYVLIAEAWMAAR